MGWVISVLILSLMILIIYFKAKRRKSRREFELRALDDKIENGKQVQLAQSAVMEECDHMIEEINAVLEAHSGQHQSDAGLVSEVRRVMQYYRSNEESRKGFLKVNRELDNRFTVRLKEDYPGMSESLLRLAALIAAGVDSSQLASILNISQKSVYTSRYRLRSQARPRKRGQPRRFSPQIFLTKTKIRKIKVTSVLKSLRSLCLKCENADFVEMHPGAARLKRQI